MPYIIRENRRLWCHKCQKEVLLKAHMWDDLCAACEVMLKPRMKEDFDEVSDAEYARRMKFKA